MEREGFESIEFGTIIPANGSLELPARDVRGAKLIVEIVRSLDVIAPRRFATVRHAGELMARIGFMQELGLDHLPLVVKSQGS
jgi:hypothetical protein